MPNLYQLIVRIDWIDWIDWLNFSFLFLLVSWDSQIFWGSSLPARFKRFSKISVFPSMNLRSSFQPSCRSCPHIPHSIFNPRSHPRTSCPWRHSCTDLRMSRRHNREQLHTEGTKANHECGSARARKLRERKFEKLPQNSLHRTWLISTKH